MYFLDSTILMLIPAIILALWSQSRIRKEYRKWSRVETKRRVTGSEAATMILRAKGLKLRIERTNRNLGDHYDPKKKVLRLSPGVFDIDSVAAVGIAAHECGHAIQHAKHYSPLAIRNSIVPVVSLGTNLAFPLFFIGFIAQIPVLMNIGIVFFAAAVAFHLITLPVEFDASARALKILPELGILTPEEISGARNVLRAAAMTYVAATLMAIVNLLRLLVLSRRR